MAKWALVFGMVSGEAVRAVIDDRECGLDHMLMGMRDTSRRKGCVMISGEESIVWDQVETITHREVR